MDFPQNIYLTALVSGFVVCLLMTPLWIRLSVRTGLMDSPGHRKIHHTPIPLAGGPSVLTSLILCLLVGGAGVAVITSSQNPQSDLWHKLIYGFQSRIWEIISIAGGALIVSILGILDDRFTFKAGTKLFWQISGAVMVAASGVRITLFVDNVVFHYLVTLFWVILLVNAFNFIDNMNGASAGLGIISVVLCSAAGHRAGQYLVPGLGFLVAGILLGFLIWNFPKARTFLGDSGSHLVGYLVAVMTIKATYYSENHVDNTFAVLSPLFFVAVPVLDICQVVLQRLKNRKPVWIGDTNHLTHMLSRTRLGKVGAVLLLWFLAALLGILPFLFS